jgi:alkylated DNA repair dioxygenase AlkB
MSRIATSIKVQKSPVTQLARSKNVIQAFTASGTGASLAAEASKMAFVTELNKSKTYLAQDFTNTRVATEIFPWKDGRPFVGRPLPDGNCFFAIRNVLTPKQRTDYLMAAARMEREQGGTGPFVTPREELAYTRNGEPYVYGRRKRKTMEYPLHVKVLSDLLLRQFSLKLASLRLRNDYQKRDTAVDIVYSSKFKRGGSIGAHADDEAEWGSIFVYSCGQTRIFTISDKIVDSEVRSKDGRVIRTKFKRGQKLFQVPLEDNSLVVMWGPTFQHKYMHEVDKLKDGKRVGMRHSLNIRYVEGVEPKSL